jgi:hypothetical protein
MRLARLMCAVLVTWSVETASSSTIYRCEAGGTITFSDRPCDSSARQYVPDSSRISTYDAPEVRQPAPGGKQTKPRKSKGSGRGAAGDSLAKRAEACDKLKNALKDIRARMRAGYSAKEGERLRERQQALQTRLRADRCR